MVDVVRMAGRGARGESFADIARRIGEIGEQPVAPDDTDNEVMDKLVQSTSVGINGEIDTAKDAALAELETAKDGAITDVDTATDAGIAELNASLAALASGAYPVSAATNVPRGLTQASVGAITAGSGGTNGTFALGWTGGNFAINPTGTFTVAGGALTAVTITGPGLYIGASPTVPTPTFTASTGLTGAAVALTAQFLISSGTGYWVQSSDGTRLNRYKNVSGVATAETGVQALYANSGLGQSSLSSRLDIPTVAFGTKSISHVDTIGRSRFAATKVRTLNGRRPEAIFLDQPLARGDLLDSLLFINNSGQSLSQAHVGGGNQTLVAEYEGRAFQYGLSAISGADGLRALVSTDKDLTRQEESVSSQGENPMFGFSFLFELLEKENGITIADFAARLITANNGKGSTSITGLNKGSVIYEAAIAQANALVDTPPETGDKVRILGTGWFHGEADTDLSSYGTLLRQLAIDYAADFRAACPAQDFDPYLVPYQPTTETAGGFRFQVSRQIFQACVDSELGIEYNGSVPPLLFAGPNYWADVRKDGLHANARSAKHLGAYVALALKRTLIDGVGWPMMRPIKVTIENGGIFIKYQMRAPGTKLVVAECDPEYFNWDGTAFPPQPGRGFSGVDTEGNALVWASLPEVVAPDTIRVIPTVSTAEVLRIDVAQQEGEYIYPHRGGPTNFRDNYGDLVFYDAINRPMHNWLPLHSILPDASDAGFTLDS